MEHVVSPHRPRPFKSSNPSFTRGDSSGFHLRSAGRKGRLADQRKAPSFLTVAVALTLALAAVHLTLPGW